MAGRAWYGICLAPASSAFALAEARLHGQHCAGALSCRTCVVLLIAGLGIQFIVPAVAVHAQAGRPLLLAPRTFFDGHGHQQSWPGRARQVRMKIGNSAEKG